MSQSDEPVQAAADPVVVEGDADPGVAYGLEVLPWLIATERGGAILMPAGKTVARSGEAFLFVPLVFWAEGDRLNFAGVLYGDHALAGTQCRICFDGDENFTGRGFIAGITHRRIGQKQAPLWTQVWAFTARANGFDIALPAYGSPWIKEEEKDAMKALHLELAQLHAEGLAARSLPGRGLPISDQVAGDVDPTGVRESDGDEVEAERPKVRPNRYDEVRDGV